MAKVTITIEDLEEEPKPGSEGRVSIYVESDPPVTEEMSVDDYTAAQLAGGQMVTLCEYHMAMVEAVAQQEVETRTVEEIQQSGDSIFLGAMEEKSCLKH